MQKDVTDAYQVPVKDFLQISEMRTSQTLAGGAGQDRGLTTLSIVETPDFIGSTQPKTFVMTGGFPLMHLGESGQGSTAALVDLVTQLDERQVAGLGVQFGPYLMSLPPEVLQRAEELAFPIIELPQAPALDRLFAQAIMDVSQIQADGLHRTEKLLQSLERLLLEGADMQGVADQLARSLSVDILVTSNDGRVMADAFSQETREELKSRDLYDDTGRFRVEQVRFRQRVNEDKAMVIAQPILAAGTDLARLIAYHPQGMIGEDIRYSLQRAGNIVALLITQQQALNAVENKYRGDFLRDVLSGRSSNSEHSKEYAQGLGWELAMPCIVVSAQIDPQDPKEPPADTQLLRAWQARFHLAWTQVVGRVSRTFPVADFSDEVVAILACREPEGKDLDDVMAELHSVVEQLVHYVSGDRGGGRRPFSVGTSRLVTSFKQFPTAYQQARRATEVGRRFTGGSNISHFDELGIHRLIGLIPEQSELVSFAEDVLGELVTDDPQSAELRTTLQVLLDHNLNVAEASRELFMHYNTMRYRIAKLEKVLGPFTTDSHLRLNIAVALQVLRIQN